MSLEQDFQRLEERLDDTRKTILDAKQEITEVKLVAKFTQEENAYLKVGTRALFAKLLAALSIVFITGVYILIKKPELALDERVHLMSTFPSKTTTVAPPAIVQDPYVNFSRYGDKIVGWTLSLFTPLFGAYMIWDKRRRPR